MRKYLNKPIGELASELAAGLVRLRKGYIDSAESLLHILEPDGLYPLEFVVYRLTGYRGGGHAVTAPISGKTLRSDLLTLMLDLCDSFELHAADYLQPVYDVSHLARRFSVSTKTIQRWCRYGMPARRLVFDGGKRRVAFLETSVQWFVQHRAGLIPRSVRFTQMTGPERDDILRRARRMAAFTRCTLSEVAHRIARRTRRAVETVRYTIRRHDLDHPADAIFPRMPGPLDDEGKVVIYRSFLRGVTAPALARRYRRTRGSIYRIVNEMRARHLADRPIDYMYSPKFDLPNADDLFLLDPTAEAHAAATAAKHRAASPGRPPTTSPHTSAPSTRSRSWTPKAKNASSPATTTSSTRPTAAAEKSTSAPSAPPTSSRSKPSSSTPTSSRTSSSAPTSAWLSPSPKSTSAGRKASSS